ncbi:MAG: serine/threonine-protein kinase [Planctomycetota bacterium]
MAFPEPEPGLSPPPDLRALVEQCVSRFPTDGARAVDEACAQYPHLAAALRRRMALLERSGFLAGDPGQTDYPDRLGDFHLLELIGEGGMGAVFRARQVSLDRQVALKVIRADLAFSPRSRERFRREIEAIAAMRSAGIVQVYVVGDEEGVPYYAMELVDGINLQDLVLDLRRTPPERLTGADLRAALARMLAGRQASSTANEVEDLFAGTYVQVCCRIAQRVARTLAYAHERGVLHRDVKPSNVMLDRSGRVLLLDFGLARAIESGDGAMTRTGALVGSPAYMAPEQMRGEPNLDGRVDVYGVGVLLYELLTHRAAFRGDTQEDLRASVLAGSVPSPQQLNPALPRDAETICLKAMAPERGRRYATTEALADDLQRFLELRPIAARRAGWPYRIRRWGQRHPARATALVATLLVAVGAPIAYAAQERVARQAITAALDRAERNQRSYELAISTVIAGMEDTTMRLAHDEQLASGKLDALRRELLEGAAAFWQTMADVDDPAPGVRDALFRAKSVLAVTRRELGDLAGARAVLAATARQIEELRDAATESERRHLDQDLAKVLFDTADVMLAQHELRPAVETLQRSAAIAESAAAAAANPGAVQRHVRRCRLNIAQAQAQLGEADAAIATCREVLAGMADEGASDAMLRARTLLAAVLLHTGRLDEAAPALQEAIDLRTQRMQADPADVANLRDLKSVHHNLGLLLQQRGDLAGARHNLERSLTLAKQLRAAFPDRLDNRLTVLSSTMVLANVLLRLGEPAAAEALCREGVHDGEVLAVEHADVADVRSTLAELRSTLGQMLIDDPARRGEAVALLRGAVEVLEARAQDPGAGPDVVSSLATTRGLLASALARSGELSESRAVEDAAFSAYEAAWKQDRQNGFVVANAARAFASASSRGLRADDEARVRAVLQRAATMPEVDEVLWTLLRELPEPSQRQLERLRPSPGDR